MLCKRNDDITYYALFIACIPACEKASHHELAVALMQRALRQELACISEAKVRICQRLVQWKGQTVSLLTIWQRLFKMQAVFSPGTALHRRCWCQIFWSEFLKRYVDTNSSKWCHSFITFVYFELYFYSIKITLGRGILISIERLTFDKAN